jgi:predicted nucleic acid-binding protein
MITCLLDSVILIDHLNGHTEATAYLARLDPEAAAVSVITRAEILVGIEEKDEPLVKAWLDLYQHLAIDKPIADLAAALRRQEGWRLPDAFQAAFCHNHRIKLITRNTKDFNPKKYDFVEVPY